MGKHLFYHFRVTNSKLKNMKFYFDLLIWKTKEQNLDFEVVRSVFLEIIQFRIIWKNVGMLDFVMLDQGGGKETLLILKC